MTPLLFFFVVCLLLVGVSNAFVPQLPKIRSSKLQATKQKVEALGKGEFVDLIASKSDISKKDCVAIIDAMRDVLADEVLNKGHEVRLRDLGTFKRKVSAPRVGRNPQTGEELQIKGSNSLGFSAASAMKIKHD
jgi:nucleoid DNA-binding protein